MGGGGKKGLGFKGKRPKQVVQIDLCLFALGERRVCILLLLLALPYQGKVIVFRFVIESI